MNKNRLLLLCLVVGFTGCTAVPEKPIEDRSVVIEPEPVEPEVIVSAVPGDDSTATESEIEEQAELDKPNKPIVPVSPKVIKAEPKNAAVIALLDSAKQQSQNGELRSAQTNLQRAQRIAPREPEVYYDLANIHLELQDYGLAEQVALKGVSIVQGQPAQLHRFWTLIADVRKASGNLAGAKKARNLASRYQ